MKLNINNKNSVLFLWFADWFWPSLSTSFQWCVDKQQPTNLLSLKCSRGEGGPTSYVTSSLFWQSGKGKMILCEVRVVLATLRCCSDPVSTSTREHLAWHQSLPKRPCSDSRGLYLYDHQMYLCRSWFLLPPPLTSNNGVSQSMNMSCLCAPCCVINPPWEPEISPATDLSWLLSFLRSWHSKQNKIYHLVFFLVFSDSVYKSTPFIFIMWLLLVCQARVLSSCWY